MLHGRLNRDIRVSEGNSTEKGICETTVANLSLRAHPLRNPLCPTVSPVQKRMEKVEYRNDSLNMIRAYESSPLHLHRRSVSTRLVAVARVQVRDPWYQVTCQLREELHFASPSTRATVKSFGDVTDSDYKGFEGPGAARTCTPKYSSLSCVSYGTTTGTHGAPRAYYS